MSRCEHDTQWSSLVLITVLCANSAWVEINQQEVYFSTCMLIRVHPHMWWAEWVIKSIRKVNKFPDLWYYFLPQFEHEATDSLALKWRRRRNAPDTMAAHLGAATVHRNTAYFSCDNRIYSYTLAKDQWAELKPCEYYNFSVAVIKDKVTTIGGLSGDKPTNILLSLEEHGTKWRKPFPPMTTARVRPATVTTPTHLIVAGGGAGYSIAVSTVEILDTNTLQWSYASSSPEALGHPHMSLCGEHLYLSDHNTIFSCSVEDLLKSCKPTSTNKSCEELYYCP